MKNFNLDLDLDPRTYHVGKYFFFSGKNHLSGSSNWIGTLKMLMPPLTYGESESEGQT